MINRNLFLLLLITPSLLWSTIETKNFNNKEFRPFSWTAPIEKCYPAEPPQIEISSAAVVEGNGGQRSVDVAVSISRPATDSIIVLYHTANGSAAAGSDYIARNDSVVFHREDIITRIAIPIIGDVVFEPNETFYVIISKVIGAVIVDSTDSVGIVTIINDDLRAVGGATPTIYEVRLTHTGYTALHGTAADCPIRLNGKVVLTGLVSGYENVQSDDDINYTGTLQMDMDMDLCSVTGDPAILCKIRIVGSGPVKAALDVYFDGRGGYIKIEAAGRYVRSASGTCDEEQTRLEEDMIPNRTIASIFNGRDLPMLTNRTLRVGRYEERDGDNVTVVEVLRVIRP